VWEALRLEAGRPAFGADLTEEHIPVEAGVHTRAIDYDKGCYTGQEVIVRLRDRGHVNRHLRRLRLGDAPSPAPGTEVWRADGSKSVGAVTSAASSPRMGTLALAYVRREVEPPGPVRLGSAEGPEVEVEALEG
jgi:folate-binding protein YgfZ